MTCNSNSFTFGAFNCKVTTFLQELLGTEVPENSTIQKHSLPFLFNLCSSIYSSFPQHFAPSPRCEGSCSNCHFITTAVNKSGQPHNDKPQIHKKITIKAVPTEYLLTSKVYTVAIDTWVHFKTLQHTLSRACIIHTF